MKVYLVTANDIEDHSAIRVFDSKEKAEAFNNAARQSEKDKFYRNRRTPYEHLEWQDKYFYGTVEEFEVE